MLSSAGEMISRLHLVDVYICFLSPCPWYLYAWSIRLSSSSARHFEYFDILLTLLFSSCIGSFLKKKKDILAFEYFSRSHLRLNKSHMPIQKCTYTQTYMYISPCSLKFSFWLETGKIWQHLVCSFEDCYGFVHSLFSPSKIWEVVYSLGFLLFLELTGLIA